MGDSWPVFTDRHAAATKISHDAARAARMDQRVADQASQGAPNQSFDAVHHDKPLRNLL